MNGGAATFCGQCFAPLSGSASTGPPSSGLGHPASAGTSDYRPGFKLGSPMPSAGTEAPPWTSSAPSAPAKASAQASGGMKLVALAIAAVVSFLAVKLLILDSGNTFVAEDGSYEFTYSDYWQTPDEDSTWGQIQDIQGIQMDVMIETDKAMVLAMHAPAPPGDMTQVDGSLIEQGFESAAYSPQLERWSVPGERDIGGERAIFDAEGYVDIAGMRAQIDIAIAVTPDDQQMVALMHACFEEACSESTGEYEKILDSVSFE